MAKDLSANLDLNLLKTLLVIYQEQNLRKASERLFVTQPAVSHALQKLRLHFDDELFTKTRTGLKPTPYVEQLCQELSPALDNLFKAVNSNQEFDPRQLTGKIRIALAPQYLHAFGSRLYLLIQQQAPDSQVEITNWSATTFPELLNGNTQIALNYDTANTSKELYRQAIPGDKGVVIVRRDHPFDKPTMSVIDAKDAGFACLIVPERSEQAADIEKYFAHHNLTATISFRSTSPETILQIVKQTDLLFPTLDIMVPDDDPDFRKIDAHIDFPVADFSTVCFYHQSKHKDPLTQWLFGLIKQLHHELV
ncbi:LysR family transcriptional regulator [Photobacterium rosenbergii]|uniref:LysR family transcriptional regulator n=1 Tax=Photobacterium rosenbergii TaxID=294936 RepID=A0A2T3N2J6_9GAMM|nr:LysR family transcriptional regulator [Photobacterium rosenbergii]PSW06441.1 LysR family transcriptional regulator [Photobacterium rosenbergii]